MLEMDRFLLHETVSQNTIALFMIWLSQDKNLFDWNLFDWNL
jgi:hypothetical protein